MPHRVRVCTPRAIRPERRRLRSTGNRLTHKETNTDEPSNNSVVIAARILPIMPATGGQCSIFVGVLIAIILTFYGIRIATDAPFLLSGIEPEPEDFESRYVAHPWLAYLHMTPGVLYLLGAPLQLSQRIRTKHYTLHRRLGRVLVTAALLSVMFAFLFDSVSRGAAASKQWLLPSSAAGS